MKKQRPTEDRSITHASLWDVFTSVGIAAMQLVEFWQYADHSNDDIQMNKLVSQLETQLQVMASATMEYEDLFKIAMTELPPNFAAIRVKNPLYVGDVTEPSYDDDGNVIDLGDDFPF